MQGRIIEPSQQELPDARTSLLESYHQTRVCGRRNCNHGTFSPTASSQRSSIDSTNDMGGRYPGGVDDNNSGSKSRLHRVMGDAVADAFFTRTREGSTMSTTKFLANKHGITNHRYMYISYYFPFVKWIQQYRWRFLKGDLIAALTMASFYIPMSLSYAANLGHVPPNQRPILVRLQSSHVRISWYVSPNGSWTRGCWVATSWDRSNNLH